MVPAEAGQVVALSLLRRLAVLLGIFVGLCGVAILAGRLLFGQPVQLETRFLHWLGSIRTDPLNTLGQRVTFLGSTLWLLGVSLVVGSGLLLKRRTADAAILLAAGIGSSAITNLVKVLVARPRPGVVPHLAVTSTLSFPSGHACSSAAVYMALALVLPASHLHRRVAMTAAALLAMAIAFSRVYLGVHYPSDVLAGLALGWLWVAAVFFALGPLKPENRTPGPETVDANTMQDAR
jgi:undecaprenyl-diphosphatase